MTTHIASDYRPKDYSLVGKDSSLAVEQGLAGAKWYATPIPKAQMRELLERRDGPAIRDTLLWFALLFGFGTAGYLLWGTWWAILPFALYGIVYASSSDSRWHESSHGTAFKTDWMNNTLYEIASFMVVRESTPWRWSHTRHHSDTIIVGRDPEIAVPRPVKLLDVALKFVGIKGMIKYFRTVFLHAAGKLTREERTYIPASESEKVFWRARIYILIYAGVIALAVATRSILPLMFVGLPTLYGTWLMVVYGLTQHAGLAENVLDHRLNTRTVYMNPINRYLYWNMGYHVEHHMFPLVPYHALPKLHALIKHDTPMPYNGLRAAYREIIPTLLRQAKDPTYFVKRPLPALTVPVIAPPVAQAIPTTPKTVVDGWVEVCDRNELQREDVLRFDHDNQTYAIYRTADDKFYATEGICTHGNAQLAEGFVQGTLIECPKHNGRFDIRDGSPQRPPVCVALKTYAVREQNGKLLLDLRSAGGSGATEPGPTYAFRVVSNENVATFIKELVLEADEGTPPLACRPGDYLQLNIPAYGARTLRDIEVAPRFADAWRTQGVFALPVGNPMPVRRNYSLAGNPAIDRQLRFNVRLALPPSGVACDAGVGSAYIFSLRRGDRVTAVGPFGQFRIKDTPQEMVYVGAGSGMAPLRSHLSHLLETQRTSRRISYWYGARSEQDVYYRDYFEALAREHPNFTFHVALSQPEAQWQGHVGHVQDVLRREYLAAHPNPQEIEYYLCGQKPMIRATTQMLAALGADGAQIAYDEF